MLAVDLTDRSHRMIRHPTAPDLTKPSSDRVRSDAVLEIRYPIGHELNPIDPTD